MDSDEFGRDPAVRSMRRVFAQMEKLQQKMLEAATLLPLDRDSARGGSKHYTI